MGWQWPSLALLKHHLRSHPLSQKAASPPHLTGLPLYWSNPVGPLALQSAPSKVGAGGYSDLLLKTKRTCPRGRSEKVPFSGCQVSCNHHAAQCNTGYGPSTTRERLDQRTQETRSQGRAWGAVATTIGLPQVALRATRDT